ncbi:MAG: choice-of-anchor J domain-containing protein, partial [Candidatus Pelagibacter ubique]
GSASITVNVQNAPGIVYIGTTNPGRVYKYISGQWIDISPQQTQICSETFESGGTSWVKTGCWQIGHPTSGPYNGYDSYDCAGTNLSGNYPDYADDWLISPQITLPSGNITLSFWEWYQIEEGYDYGYVLISTDGGYNWNELSYRTGYSDWTRTTINLSAYAGQTIKLAFRLTSDCCYNYAGWYVDNIEIVASESLGETVISFAKYNGSLYIGVRNNGIGQVWRYNGGTSWTLVGDNMDGEVDSLAVYNGQLYAGTSWNGMRLYKYTPGTTNCDIPNWTRVVDYFYWSGTRVLYVFNNYLLMGDIGYDRFGLWDGSNFYAVCDGGGSCIYDMKEFNGKVYAAAWDGRLWETSDGWNWYLTLSDEYGSRMWELEVYNNYLYMAYDNCELRKSNIPNRGELVYTAPDSIISMATDGTKLYFGTGRESTYSSNYGYGIANVYMYDGNNVTLISPYDTFGDGVQEIFVDMQ